MKLKAISQGLSTFFAKRDYPRLLRRQAVLLLKALLVLLFPKTEKQEPFWKSTAKLTSWEPTKTSEISLHPLQTRSWQLTQLMLKHFWILKSTERKYAILLLKQLQRLVKTFPFAVSFVMKVLKARYTAISMAAARSAFSLR